MNEQLVGAEHNCYEPPTAALRQRSSARLQAELTRYLDSAGPDVRRDWRDVLVILATYYDCAARIGVDPIALFDAASVEAEAAVSELAGTFSRRRDITLEAFGWVLTELPEGPCYESAHPISYERVKALIEQMGGHVA